MRALAIAAAVALTTQLASVAHADTINVPEFRLEAADGGWQLRATFDFELTGPLEEAVNKGIPLYFVTEFVAQRPRWYWFDDRAISATQTFRLAYLPLTRQYRVSTGGGLQQRFSRLDDALAVIRNIRSWPVGERGALRPGETYQTAVRMRLDVTQLPKPFQVAAFNSRDWNLASEWRYGTITVPER